LIIGEVKINNIGNKFKIISKNIDKSTNKHTYYNIEFLESGYQDCVRSDSINRGLVKDNLHKSCCGVGMIGYINTRKHFHEYKIWRNMIYRCCCKSDKSYKYYGGKGVTVCKRWHRFDYFFADIKTIHGYSQQAFDDHKLRLDKDLLSINHKIYSPQTTMWVTDLTNQKRRANEYNEQNKKYAIFPDGHIEQIYHVTDFCKTYGLHKQNVNLCLAGEQCSTKGFKFYKEY
jgi:hypothetical protein